MSVTREVGKLCTLDSLGSHVMIENARCPDHYELPIQYYCLSCNVHCFCSECALTTHSHCDIMTLTEAFTTVVNTQVNRWISQINTRSENLQISFKKLLEDKRDQWTLKLQDLINNSVQTNNKLQEDMEEIRASVSEWVEQSNKRLTSEIESRKSEINNLLKELEEITKKLRNERNNQNKTQLLYFYNQNYNYLREIILGHIHGVDTLNGSNKVNGVNGVDGVWNGDVKKIVSEMKERMTENNNLFKEMMSKLTELQHNIRNCHAVEKY
ncbi:B-box zinc finger family protein [Theileria parva strain Muguga]|uniref:B-box zinc finger family protein n=1 Tax=Theileria parva strain Muguga TaxID=333668 RepID=UPI001C6191E1|nr:B-box zinc finger family protein [Theileria parva strain Muguga]KAF5153693.1 B-box zinc finger family protein [Theileria parva strain Muguga]